MPDDDGGMQDVLRQWGEMSRGLLEGGEAAEPLRARCEALFAAWGRFARTWAEAAGAGAPGAGGPFDPAGWMDAGGAGGWGDLWRWFGAAEGGDPWRAERDALRASAEWSAYGRALERYNSVMATAWMKAFGRFAQGLAVGSTAAEETPDWAAMQARWQAAADAELASAQGSEEFLDAQRELIRARLACAALLRKRVEGLAQILGLPSRAEIDSLHETVHRMGRELRALRARLDATGKEPGG
ncbi:MAG TPA: poly(R)-hydroxyalkanoic acid synthase subunit PhaE [Thermohalobaculum sp.]|nr:poly(R)-hydroxyalkanoic acid synthase subunit PhaE [Thermohalobaculum sp.]